MKFLKNLVIAVIFSLLPIKVSYALDSPEKLVTNYFLAIKSQDWNGAKIFWDSSYIESTERFGISYQTVPAKYDCASPFVLAAGAIHQGVVTLAIDSMVKIDDFARIDVTLKTDSDTVSARYYAVMTDLGWRLTSPAKLYSRDWNRLTTRYLNLYYSDSSRINDFACKSADRFIEETGSLLGLSQSEMTKLSERKIDYYLCDKDEIKSITGYHEAGMTDLPSDAIISQYFPHNHELTHLLVNYALPNLPLYTQPFLQEGLACHLGGRWGRAVNVIKYAGSATLEFDVVELEQILSYDRFKHQIGMPDISYPVSSLFVGYIIDAVGMEKFLELYRQFSGDSSSELMLQSESKIIISLEELLGRSWDEIKTDFDLSRKQFVHAGIIPTELEQTGLGDYSIQSGDFAVSIRCLPKKNVIDILFFTTSNSGTISFRPLDTLIQKYQSSLFAEHYPGVIYDGCRFGLRFSPVEASLYDYWTNDLIATFSTGFSPTESISVIAKGRLPQIVNRILLGIEKSVFDEPFDSYAIELIPPSKNIKMY